MNTYTNIGFSHVFLSRHKVIYNRDLIFQYNKKGRSLEDFMDIVPERIKKIWGAWDIRVFILISLVSQILLVLLAPLRKRKQHKRFARFTWLAYLMADWVAIFALGLLSNGQDDSSDFNRKDDLLALWAPFLLLHLGGPDTITAFALEDNELWFRHLFGLIYQLVPAVYVFSRTFPGNKLLAPIILIFIVGIIKYCERTWALYQASADVFSESMTQGLKPGPDYEKLREEYIETMKAKKSKEQDMDTTSEGFLYPLDHIQIIQFAYHFFYTFKGLLVDVLLNFDDLRRIQRFFVRWSANDAFKIIEIELNFMYEVLYTKAAVVHSQIGYVLRFISICSFITALCLFFSHDKNGQNYFDKAITYTLFIGGLSLEAIGLFNLIFSEWTIVALKNYNVLPFISKFHLFIFGGPRWSESIPQRNLITVALVERPKWMEKIVEHLCLKSILDEMRYRSRRPMIDDLKLVIFEKLKEKSLISIPHSEEINAKNNWAKVAKKFLKQKTPYVLPNTSAVENFDESILVLHVATELCYHNDSSQVFFTRATGKSSGLEERLICKVLSDYMFDLLVMQPTMIPSLGIWKVIYQDTCSRLKELSYRYRLLETEADIPSACVRLLKADVARNRGSRSILPDAIELARKMLEERGTWKELSSRWVEMLCNAASRSRANMHAQHLGKGGELLTFVWLLMAHLGLQDLVM